MEQQVGLAVTLEVLDLVHLGGVAVDDVLVLLEVEDGFDQQLGGQFGRHQVALLDLVLHFISHLASLLNFFLKQFSE